MRPSLGVCTIDFDGRVCRVDSQDTIFNLYMLIPSIVAAADVDLGCLLMAWKEAE